MTKAISIGRPVRCAKCQQPFTRTHGRQKLCTSCRPAWVNTRTAVRAVKRSATPADTPLREDAGRWISVACREPRARQAELIPEDMKRRHPSPADGRPEFSGYCVIAACECSCHRDGRDAP